MPIIVFVPSAPGGIFSSKLTQGSVLFWRLANPAPVDVHLMRALMPARLFGGAMADPEILDDKTGRQILGDEQCTDDEHYR
jgi:hypothetical protein